jgi:predicted  nucleic acid-binding Zn-ribbon protein
LSVHPSNEGREADRSRRIDVAGLRFARRILASPFIQMDATVASERDRIMKILRSLGFPLVAAATILGSAGLAYADPPTLTKALADLADATKTFAQLQDERDAANAALKQAQAELDVVSKLSPKATDDIAKIQKRVDDANATLKHNAELTEAKKRAFNESAKRIIERHANNPQPGTGANPPASQPASNQPGPNSDLAAELEKLAADRVKAEAELAKAKADLDALKKQDPQSGAKTEELKKKIQDAQARIKHANDTLGRIPDRKLAFKATSQDEVNQAQQLPQKIQAVLNTINSIRTHKINDNVSVEGSFDPSSKQGTITIHWKGNP